MKKVIGYISSLAIMAAFVLVFASMQAGAADHLDAPLVANDGRTDINDIYAFQSPDNPDNTVFVMTVNPLAGVVSPTSFRPNAVYRFHIDNGASEWVYQLQFGGVNGAGNQRINLKAYNTAGGVLVNNENVGFSNQTVMLADGGKLTASVFDDPFFFDLVAFQDQVQGQGGNRTFCDGNEADFFAGANVSAIVLELPSDSLTADSSVLKIWANVEYAGQQIDRMGLPAINTVLIPSSQKDTYNLRQPRTDVSNWTDEVSGSLQALSGLDGSGYTAAEANGIAALLLPDVLTLDTSSSDGFVPGLNGRQLADDVIDFELFVVTGGLGAENEPAGTAVLDSDCVDGNDVAFSNSFPYLAPAH